MKKRYAVWIRGAARKGINTLIPRSTRHAGPYVKHPSGVLRGWQRRAAGLPLEFDLKLFGPGGIVHRPADARP